jgi:hypothetical protein
MRKKSRVEHFGQQCILKPLHRPVKNGNDQRKIDIRIFAVTKIVELSVLLIALGVVTFLWGNRATQGRRDKSIGLVPADQAAMRCSCAFSSASNTA